jgi:predicted Rossmann-fold nucleotide-binding protein
MVNDMKFSVLITIVFYFSIFADASNLCSGVYEEFSIKKLPMTEDLTSSTFLKVSDNFINIKTSIRNLEFKISDLKDKLKPKIYKSEYEYDGDWSLFELFQPQKIESKKMSDSEKKEIEDNIAVLEQKLITLIENRKALSRQYIEMAEIEKGTVLKKIQSLSLKNRFLANSIKDYLGYYSIVSMKKKSVVSLVVGKTNTFVDNHVTLPTDIHNLVKDLMSKNKIILFDGESIYAHEIALLVENQGVAIFSNTVSEKNIKLKNKVVIQNDYLRMEALSHATDVIVDSHSTLGLGLIVESRASYFLGDSKVISQLDFWQKSLDSKERNLGVKIILPKKIKSLDDIKSDNTNSTNSDTFFNLSLRDLSFDYLKQVYDESASFVQAYSSNKISRSAVVFGSSQYDRASAQLIYKTSFILSQFGVSVFTGGSSGAMHIANTGAYNAGGDSIGVPIGGKNLLSSEKDVFSNKQTSTIYTSNYAERIPTLLGNNTASRNFIVFAPGGNGTIKELATTLFLLANTNKSTVNKVVFLDSDYYGPLVRLLTDFNLVNDFSKKIEVIDSETHAQALVATAGYKKTAAKTRSNENKFEIPKQNRKVMNFR